MFKTHPKLLTPSVFLKTAKEIEEIVNLEIFKTHPELLTPRLFNSTSSEILSSYFMYELYKLESYITSSHLSLKAKEIYSKKKFLDDQFKPLTIETHFGKIKLNPIFLMQNKNIKLTYNTTKKELLAKYDYSKSDEKEIIEDKVKTLLKK